ncbi:ABC transporter substrate-binding protein [Murimonas intestini]|uniref:Carbohydrate ABC transporter substrate-binding protein (CUT1 family) n=1 Tax=Murimonas intestini TaxID=1337051 RepID=A0AB73T3E0_9FIRM|nr:extracellular solute-binding protein [Murimonas intestini]MCR1841083.1 extracellular solute-binding protein [Murimonas intestini]MCR1865799.1 extracellular solute-binding protein [Murimonas intestini]MCR1883219.1 extracellular solute-binding protein [Murimonas intestini]
MKRRVLAAGCAAMVAAVSLAGCGGSGSEPETPQEKNVSENVTEKKEASAKKEIVLKVASRYSNDNPDENFYRKKVQEFSDLDNGIKIEMDNISTEADYFDKIRTSFANGDVPNVFLEYGGSRCLDYMEADALVDLRPYLEENNKEWYNQFYESMWRETQYEGYDGIYAVPFKCYFVALYYNKEIFNEAGLEPPKSVEEMMDVCEKLLEKGIQPFQVGEKDAYRFGHFNNNLIIKTYGIEAVEKLASRELSYDSDEMKSTYQVIADMVAKGYLGKDLLATDSTTENAVFEQGKAAMHYDGTWYIANNLFGTEFYDKVGVVPFPYGDESCKNYAQGGSSDMFYVSKLNKSDEEIQASIEFLKWLTDPSYYQELDQVAQTIQPVKFERTSKTENPLLDEAIAIQSEITDMRTDVQNYDPESHMMDTVRSSLQSLAMGDTPEQCAQNIMDRMQEYKQ